MPKRTRSQLAAEDVIENEGDDGEENIEYTQRDLDEEYGYESDDLAELRTQKESQDIATAVAQVIRVVTGRELKGQFIKRENITSAISNNRVSYDLVMKKAIEALEDIYGLTLVRISAPTVEDERGQRASKKRTAPTRQPYVLVNCLEQKSREALGEVWTQCNNHENLNGRNIHENQVFLPKSQKSSMPTTNIELLKSGIMILIVSLLIISENHLPERELIKSLRRFGISENVNIKNSNLNMNLFELLAEISRKEYINKNIRKGSTDSETVVDYSLGRRSLTEFVPTSVFEFMKAIFRDKFDRVMGEKSIVTIERAYGVKLNINDWFEPESEIQEPQEANPLIDHILED